MSLDPLSEVRESGPNEVTFRKGSSSSSRCTTSVTNDTGALASSSAVLLWPERWEAFSLGELATSTGEACRVGRKQSRALPTVARNTELTTRRRYSWIFAIEGIFTVVVGVTAYWWVPGYPRDATFLNEREHAILMDRLRKGSDSADNEPFNWVGVCTYGTEGTEIERSWLTLHFLAGDAFKDPWVIGYGMLFHFFAFTLCQFSASNSGAPSLEDVPTAERLHARQTRSRSFCRPSSPSSATLRGARSS